jgi:hypothetical protein
MYSNQLAIAIKHNGKILRENKDIVTLPFGSEFTIFVKNLNSRRVKFSLQIDGTDVLDGEHIVVDANSSTEIKRFLKKGNMEEGNAFKFIERTEAIENGPRGIKIDDGVVRIEYWFEKEKPIYKDVYYNYHYNYPYWKDWFWNQGPYYGSCSSIASDDFSKTLNSDDPRSVLRGLNATSEVKSASLSANASLSDAKYSAESIPLNDTGITVPGSKVEQKFTEVYGFNAETTSNVMILRLTGYRGEKKVAEAVTVKTKQKCITCGHINKATAKFCAECGTSLEIL